MRHYLPLPQAAQSAWVPMSLGADQAHQQATTQAAATTIEGAIRHMSGRLGVMLSHHVLASTQTIAAHHHHIASATNLAGVAQAGLEDHLQTAEALHHHLPPTALAMTILPTTAAVHLLLATLDRPQLVVEAALTHTYLHTRMEADGATTMAVRLHHDATTMINAPDATVEIETWVTGTVIEIETMTETETETAPWIDGMRRGVAARLVIGVEAAAETTERDVSTGSDCRIASGNCIGGA